MVFRKVNMQWMCSFCSATGVKLCRRIFSIYYERLFFFLCYDRTQLCTINILSCVPSSFLCQKPHKCMFNTSCYRSIDTFIKNNIYIYLYAFPCFASIFTHIFLWIETKFLKRNLFHFNDAFMPRVPFQKYHFFYHFVRLSIPMRCYMHGKHYRNSFTCLILLFVFFSDSFIFFIFRFYE